MSRAPRPHLQLIKSESLPAYLRPLPAATSGSVRILAPRAAEITEQPSAA